MFGYYDPKSLKIDAAARQASIDFIDCADAGNIRTIEIRTPQRAQDVVRALRRQAEASISCLEGEVVTINGSIAFNEAQPDEAVVITNSEPKRTIPVRTNFFVTKGQLPRFGNAHLRGVELDGAFIAHTLVIKPAIPGFEPRPSIFDRSGNSH